MQPIYLDYNATTPVSPKVRDAMWPWLGKQANASSTHAYGKAARNAVETAREQVAQLIGASPAEILFTSGATQALHLGLECALAAASSSKSVCLRTAVEHQSVLNAFAARQEEFTELVIPVDASGVAQLTTLEALWSDHVLMGAVQLANPETGVIQPLQTISAIAKQHNSQLLVDATQAIRKMPVNAHDLGASMLALSSHKIFGPQGAGALFVSKYCGLPVAKSMQRTELALGTLNVAAIVGFGAAAADAQQQLQHDMDQMREVQQHLEAGVRAIPGTTINAATSERLLNTTNVRFDGVEAVMLLEALQQHLAAATGSACSSSKREPSHVLKAMGLLPDEILGSVRFSTSAMTSTGEIDRALHHLAKAVAALR